MAKAGVQKGKPNLATSHFRLEGHRRRWQKDSLEAGATAVRGSDAVEETQLLQSRHLTQSTGETYPPPPLPAPGPPSVSPTGHSHQEVRRRGGQGGVGDTVPCEAAAEERQQWIWAAESAFLGVLPNQQWTRADG